MGQAGTRVTPVDGNCSRGERDVNSQQSSTPFDADSTECRHQLTLGRICIRYTPLAAVYILPKLRYKSVFGLISCT